MVGHIEVDVIGAGPILKAFRDLPKEASDALRDRSQQIALELVPALQAAARAEGRQAALMAATVKVKRDRIPVVVAGGPKRVGRRRVPAGGLIFGSEFGSKRRQFKRHLGGGSYWFRETVEARDSEIYASWLKAADDVLNEFAPEAR